MRKILLWTISPIFIIPLTIKGNESSLMSKMSGNVPFMVGASTPQMSEEEKESLQLIEPTEEEKLKEKIENLEKENKDLTHKEKEDIKKAKLKREQEIKDLKKEYKQLGKKKKDEKNEEIQEEPQAISQEHKEDGGSSKEESIPQEHKETSEKSFELENIAPAQETLEDDLKTKTPPKRDIVGLSSQKNYLVIYSSKLKTTVPVLTLPRFSLRYKIGYTYLSTAPKQVFTISYWLDPQKDDKTSNKKVSFEDQFMLVCFDKDLKPHYYRSQLTNRNHLCYLNKSQVMLDPDNDFQDEIQVVSNNSIEQILLLSKDDESIMGVKDPKGYHFLYYNIYTTEFGTKPLVPINFMMNNRK